uniref:Uncharacterized protein n=1 Tax=Anguilla anguilla TaxID=7936 RepID=A0A0E9SU14_ANGAN
MGFAKGLDGTFPHHGFSLTYPWFVQFAYTCRWRQASKWPPVRTRGGEAALTEFSLPIRLVAK